MQYVDSKIAAVPWARQFVIDTGRAASRRLPDEVETLWAHARPLAELLFLGVFDREDRGFGAAFEAELAQ
jgi:hypothetical protein